MIAPDLETAIDQPAATDRARARVIVPFTGAGISTECGIPDFRSPGRVWTQEPADPVTRTSSPARQCATKPGGAASRMEENFSAARPGARPSRAGISLHRAGKICPRHNAEHRQPASSLRLCPGMRSRTARQYDLRHMPATAISATNCPGCANALSLRKRRPIAPAAAATSSRRRCPSASPCRLSQCSVRKS